MSPNSLVVIGTESKCQCSEHSSCSQHSQCSQLTQSSKDTLCSEHTESDCPNSPFRQARFLVRINDDDRWLPGQPYHWIRMFALGRIIFDDGWVDIRELGDRGTMYQYLYSTRKEIAPLLIENGKRYKFRIDVKPERVEVV